MPYKLILPEIVICSVAIILLILDLILPEERKRWIGYLGIFGLLATLLSFGFVGKTDKLIFSGTYAIDSFAFFFKFIVLGACLLTTLSSIDYIQGKTKSEGEFYLLLLFATLGMMLMSSSSDLITIYISLELTGITCYILAGYFREEPKSTEAALKYFLLGALCSATMLYGMSLLYGLTGSTNICQMAKNLLARDIATTPALIFSALLLLVGFGFKVAMVPFHLWAPDTYEGAPTPVAAFLSVGSKSAGFAILMRVFLTAILGIKLHWVMALAIGSAFTMTLGNLSAIPQRNIIRMLAYSSIAQAGYILIGFVCATKSQLGLQGTLVYLLVYLFMNMGAFIVAIIFFQSTKSNLIEDYAGLFSRAPLIAVSLAIFLLSLAGIPPLAGFIGKFLVFAAAIKTGFAWLAIVGVVNTVISIYYYANVIRYMFLRPAKETTPIPQPTTLKIALLVSLLATLLLVPLAQPFIQFTQTSLKILAQF